MIQQNATFWGWGPETDPLQIAMKELKYVLYFSQLGTWARFLYNAPSNLCLIVRKLSY